MDIRTAQKKLNDLASISPEAVGRIAGYIDNELARLGGTAACLRQEQRDMAVLAGVDPSTVALAAAKASADAAALKEIPAEMMTFLKARHGGDTAAILAGYRQIQRGQEIEREAASRQAVLAQAKGWR